MFSSNDYSPASIRTAKQKFVPEHDVENGNKVCNLQEKLVVECMKKAGKAGGNCNSAFSAWNQCLARDCGYTQE